VRWRLLYGYASVCIPVTARHRPCYRLLPLGAARWAQPTIDVAWTLYAAWHSPG
jgi:hypothetical protein